MTAFQGRTRIRQSQAHRDVWLPALLCTVGALSTAAVAQEATPAPAPTEASTASSPRNRAATSKSVGDTSTGFALSADGESRLHLRLDTGVGFDSNPYSQRFEANFGLDGGKFQGDFFTSVTPGIELTIPGNIFALDFSSSVSAGLYPGAFNPGITEGWDQLFSGTQQGTRAPSLIRLSTKGDVEINRDGMFSFAMGDTLSFNRNPLAGNLTLGNVVNNDFRIGGGFRPGGGTLRIRTNAQFTTTLFLPTDPVAAITGGDSSTPGDGDFNSLGLAGEIRADYRFLPRTGFFGSLNVGAHTYIKNLLGTGSQVNSFPLRAQVGVMGQITPSISGLASVGYDLPLLFDSSWALISFQSFSSFSDISQITAFNLQAEARWRISHAIQLAGGFMRTTSPTPIYMFRTPNKLYVRYQQAILNFLTVQAYGGVALTQFGADVNAGTDASITNAAAENGFLSIDPELKLGLAYHVTEWFSVGLNNAFFLHIAPGMESKAGDFSRSTDFVRNETLLTLSLHY